MKVLHMSSGGPICGISTYTQNLIKHFGECSSHDFFEIPEKIEMNDFSKKEIFDFFKTFVKKCENYDVVHIQNEFGFFTGKFKLDFSQKVFYKILKDLSKKNIKTFVTYHSEPVFLKALGFLNFENKTCAKYWKKMSKLHTAKNGVTAIVHTESSKKVFRDSGFKSVEVIPHGVLERNLPKKFSIKEKDDYVVLGIFGFISAYKGHEFALSILDLLPSNFKLYIIGGRHPNSEAEEIGRLVIKANELGLSKRLIITGWTSPEDADIHQSHCDICLVPYQTTEISASGAVTWNLTSGRPVIASNIRSFREINKKSKDGDSMLLCHHTDRVEWVWAIKKILNEPKTRNSLINNARKYCNDFSWTNTCKKHIELYKQ